MKLLAIVLMTPLVAMGSVVTTHDPRWESQPLPSLSHSTNPPTSAARDCNDLTLECIKISDFEQEAQAWNSLADLRELRSAYSRRTLQANEGLDQKALAYLRDAVRRVDRRISELEISVFEQPLACKDCQAGSD